MTKKKENRGGKRPNQTGRPKKQVDYDQKFKKSILKAAKNLEKEKGRPIEEEILSLVYDDNTQDAVKASIWKTYTEMFTVKKTEKKEDININQGGPAIGLPPARKDPALEVVEGGKK